LTSSAWNFQANPTATWADAISQLTTGKFFPNDSCKFFIIAENWPTPQSEKLWHYDLLERETVVSTVAADTCICSTALIEQKDLTPKLAIENAI